MQEPLETCSEAMQHGDDFRVDENGNPAGGVSLRTGLAVYWQNGPIDVDNPRNGAFVEELIEVAIARLEFYQASKFNCIENQNALFYLKFARQNLQARTNRRIEEGKEGTHEV